MSTHPYRGIVWPESLSSIPDDLDTLTRKSAGMNDAPRYPPQGPVTWNPAWTQPNLRYVYGPVISTNFKITMITLPPFQESIIFCVRYLTIVL